MTEPNRTAGDRGAGTVAPLPIRETRWPTRQTLFPIQEAGMVSADALGQAENALRALGFLIARPAEGVWLISWPGTALKIWRYSPVELCQFVRDQAGEYAAHAQKRHGGRRP